MRGSLVCILHHLTKSFWNRIVLVLFSDGMLGILISIGLVFVRSWKGKVND